MKIYQKILMAEWINNENYNYDSKYNYNIFKNKYN